MRSRLRGVGVTTSGTGSGAIGCVMGSRLPGDAGAGGGVTSMSRYHGRRRAIAAATTTTPAAIIAHFGVITAQLGAVIVRLGAPATRRLADFGSDSSSRSAAASMNSGVTVVAF